MTTIRTITITALAVLLLTAASCGISIRTSKQVDGGVFRSDDSGTSWSQQANAGLTKRNKPITIDNVDVKFIRFDPKNASVYLGTIGAGVYRSDDSGANWIKTGLAAGTYGTFAIDPSSSSILYAAAGGTISKSSDGGAQWSLIYVESRPDRSITDLAVAPGDSSNILASTNKGEVLLSKDFGNTWQLFSQLKVADSIAKLQFAPTSSTVLYALTQVNGLFKSADGGATWVSLKDSLAKFPGATTITSIAVLPQKTDTLYVASGYGLLLTEDGGTSWKPIQTLVPFASQPIQLVAVNPLNPQILYVIVGNRLRKSEDGGLTWDAKITIPTGRLMTTLVINAEHPNQLFIGTLKPKK